MVKTCPNCGHTKDASQFGVRARHEDGSVKWLASWCRECSGEACREWRNKKGEDPAKRRARQRRWLAQLDPETAAVRRDQNREHYRKRNGVTPDRFRTSRYLTLTAAPGKEPLLPVGPFAEWLRQVVDRDGTTIKATALRLGIPGNKMHMLLNERRPRVRLATVERALIADDTIMLRDLYPSLYETAGLAVAR